MNSAGGSSAVVGVGGRETSIPGFAAPGPGGKSAFGILLLEARMELLRLLRTPSPSDATASGTSVSAPASAPEIAH
jgi:hypothetical protein